jgi:hypothetical protein
MTQSLAEVAAMLRTAGATVARVRTALPQAALAGDAFSADAPGALGAAGARLHELWRVAVDARVAEACEMAERLDEAAGMVAGTALRYEDAEHQARQGWTEAP